MIVKLLIAGAIGLVIGVGICHILNRLRTTYGTLRIDHYSEEKDIYRFEIEDVLKPSKKRAILKIDHNADLSQK